MKTDELTTIDKKRLATAYMRLYDALVLRCQSQNMSHGESWYHALCEIKDILAKHKEIDNAPVMSYLIDFHNAHKKTQSKKMMTASDKDVHTAPMNKLSGINDNVQIALAELEKVITGINTQHVLVIIPKTSNASPYAGTFYGWANTLPDEQIDALENDPEEFARQYRRFAFSRHAKEK